VALALQEIGPIDTGCGDLDEDLVRSRAGCVKLLKFEHVWRARLRCNDGFHTPQRARGGWCTMTSCLLPRLQELAGACGCGQVSGLVGTQATKESEPANSLSVPISTGRLGSGCSPRLRASGPRRGEVA
jgi:hypothetical protein